MVTLLMLGQACSVVTLLVLGQACSVVVFTYLFHRRTKLSEWYAVVTDSSLLQVQLVDHCR